MGEWYLDSLEYLGQYGNTSIGANSYKNYIFESLNTYHYNLLISERFINSDGLPFQPNSFFESGTILKCYKENGIQILGNHCPYSYNYYLTIAGLDSKGNDINVYPNPANDYINIENSGDGNFTLYNQLGQLVFSIELTLGKNTIKTSGLEQGIYYYIIENNGLQINDKLIKL